MGEMVDKVARAMAESNGVIWGGPMGEDDPSFLLMKISYLSMARAAIEAMREPTPEMLGNVDGWVTEGDVWRSMIDEALKD